jgi:hypothetical protein
MKVKWEEPVEFYRAFAQAAGAVTTRKSRLVAGIVVAAAVAVIIPAFQLFFFWLHKKDLGVPVYVYFVAPTIAGVFVYFLPAMAATIPATIVLTEKGIHCNRALGTHLSMELWPWDSIATLTVENMKCGPATFPVLVLRFVNDPGEIVLGLGTTPVERIDQAVRRMGKTLDVQT